LTIWCRLMSRMPIEDGLNVPPIVKEIVGEDDTRLGAAVLAYHYIWRIACGENGGLEKQFDTWLINKPWLEFPPESNPAGLTPLQKIRVNIDKERQRLLAKGLKPCLDLSLN